MTESVNAIWGIHTIPIAIKSYANKNYQNNLGCTRNHNAPTVQEGKQKGVKVKVILSQTSNPQCISDFKKHYRNRVVKTA